MTIHKILNLIKDANNRSYDKKMTEKDLLFVATDVYEVIHILKNGNINDIIIKKLIKHGYHKTAQTFF